MIGRFNLKGKTQSYREPIHAQEIHFAGNAGIKDEFEVPIDNMTISLDDHNFGKY